MVKVEKVRKHLEFQVSSAPGSDSSRQAPCTGGDRMGRSWKGVVSHTTVLVIDPFWI